MRLSLEQARRIAISAQGLDRAAPTRVTMRQFQGVIDRLGVIQIDSVNVLARAHLLPVFSRLGAYDISLFERAAKSTPPRLVEYWAHEAALIPPATFHLMRHRMTNTHPTRRQFIQDNPELIDTVIELITNQGAMTARQVHDELGHTRGPKVHWGWNWTTSKLALEALFSAGRLVVARRSAQFERLYDLPRRILGPIPEPVDPTEAATELVRIAARACGIGSVGCLADYFRMRTDSTKLAITSLLSTGELIPVTVKGWNRELYLHAEAAKPRRVAARALLAPFDPLVWERRRLLELFGMHYRIGIYTPATKREHGYYVLPFLLGEQMVGRVDLKADRKVGVLRALQVTWEPDAPPHAAVELEEELHLMATWLGLDEVAITL